MDRWTGRLSNRLISTILVFLLALVLPSSLSAQELQGFVRDHSTGTPLVSVLVRVDSLGSVTLTDYEGRFILRRLPKGRYTLVFKAMGYDSLRLSADVPADPPLEIRLHPRPVELRGIEVRAPSVLTRMDTRLARLPGITRVVNPERVRLYDTVHRKDPWKLLWRELRVGWDFDEDAIRYRGFFRNKVEPEVYIDDHRAWLLDLVLMPNTLLCRVELYEPPAHSMTGGSSRGARAAAAAAAAISEATGRAASSAAAGAGAVAGTGADADLSGWGLGLVPFQLRAYTCLFMAEVAEGKRTFRRNINFGGLIAGPGG